MRPAGFWEVPELVTVTVPAVPENVSVPAVGRLAAVAPVTAPVWTFHVWVALVPVMDCAGRRAETKASASRAEKARKDARARNICRVGNRSAGASQ